jgi:hypothetical protein
MAPLYLYLEPQISSGFCADFVANIFIFIIMSSLNETNEKARPKYCHDVGSHVYIRHTARLHGRAMYRWEVSMVPRCDGTGAHKRLPPDPTAFQPTQAPLIAFHFDCSVTNFRLSTEYNINISSLYRA